MTHTPTAWWDFGYFGIFACVFLEQIGIPIPAFPSLLAAGALITSGELNLPGCLFTALVAALMADSFWFSVGRIKGSSVLSLMCRLAWRPDTCTSKTKTAFGQHGLKTLLFSKFIPGLSVLSSPLAGMTQVPAARFFLYDSVGILIWAMTPLLAGLYFQHSLASLQEGVVSIKAYLPWVCGALIIIVLVWRYLNRRRYLRLLNISLKRGITAEEVKSLLDANHEMTIVDVRAEMDLAAYPDRLPRSRWLPYTALPARLSELSLTKPLVLYCDCPKDEASVAVTDMLLKSGAKDARPLLGGLSGWIKKGFETTRMNEASS